MLKKFKKQSIFILAVVIFVVANYLMSFLSFRLDLSNGRAYTLSPATQKILGNLKNTVTIKFYSSSDIPTRLIPVKTNITDFLNEYQRFGKGKVVVKILDPKKDKQALGDVQKDGLPVLQFSQLEADKYAVTSAYFGMVITLGESKEIIAQATDVDNLEYNLTAAIFKLTNKNIGQIGYLGKAMVFDQQQDDIYSLKKVLSQQYRLDPINIDLENNKKTIPADYKVILVFDDNQKEYKDEEITAIKNYLNQKGSAIFFVDGKWVTNSLDTVDANHQLFNLMRDWGINLNQDLVLSTSAELVNFGNQSVQFFSPYPFWLKTTNFNLKEGSFSNVRQLTFPWVSSLTVSKKSGFQQTELVKTSNRSWSQAQIPAGGLDPQNIKNPSIKDLRSFIVAASSKKGGGQIVVIPSSRFILERYLTQTSDNLEFVFNLINNLASGGALSGIRSRAVSFYPLPDLSENQKDFFKYGNILVLPLVFGIYGVIKLFKRR